MVNPVYLDHTKENPRLNIDNIIIIIIIIVQLVLEWTLPFYSAAIQKGKRI